MFFSCMWCQRAWDAQRNNSLKPIVSIQQRKKNTRNERTHERTDAQKKKYSNAVAFEKRDNGCTVSAATAAADTSTSTFPTHSLVLKHRKLYRAYIKILVYLIERCEFVDVVYLYAREQFKAWICVASILEPVPYASYRHHQHLHYPLLLQPTDNLPRQANHDKEWKSNSSKYTTTTTIAAK